VVSSTVAREEDRVEFGGHQAVAMAVRGRRGGFTTAWGSTPSFFSLRLLLLPAAFVFASGTTIPCIHYRTRGKDKTFFGLRQKYWSSFQILFFKFYCTNIDRLAILLCMEQTTDTTIP
jgi:hypothetical protein